jgi:hypothetical protein
MAQSERRHAAAEDSWHADCLTDQRPELCNGQLIGYPYAHDHTHQSKQGPTVFHVFTLLCIRYVNLKESDYLKDLRVDGSTLMKLILRPFRFSDFSRRRLETG